MSETLDAGDGCASTALVYQPRTFMKSIVTPLTVLLSALPMALHAARAQAKPTRPNIVFIMTDDQAYDAVGGGERFPFLKTPQFDRLKQSGLTFANAFVTTSLCSPSRATIMTGMYAHLHGVLNHTPCLDPKDTDILLGEYLQRAGYRTGFVGKWHMKETDVPRRGFDHWFSFMGQGRYWDPLINNDGNRSVIKGYVTDILTEDALRFISQENQNPFCLFLWHKAPHGPHQPNKAYEMLYHGAVFPEPKNHQDGYSEKPEFFRRGLLWGIHEIPWAQSEGRAIPASIPVGPWKSDPALLDYLRVIQSVDDSLGAVLDRLEKLGLRDNTLVIYTSDNGLNVGSHNNSRIDKRLMWEESIRIPLVFSYPEKIQTGTVSCSMVLNLDLPATLLELAGVPQPANYQGKSLVPLFDQPTKSLREDFMYEYFTEGYAPGIPTIFGVRGSNYTYTHYSDQKAGESEEYYDLTNDPYELQNLARSAVGHIRLIEGRQRLSELENQLRVQEGYKAKTKEY